MPMTLDDIQRKYGESVYPLYKEQTHEPYMETENGNGILGEVLYDELEDKVKCYECDKWFGTLNSHLGFIHKMTTDEYKEKYGIYKNVPIQSKYISKRQSQCGKKSYENKLKLGLKPIKKGHRLIPTNIKNSVSKMMYKNKHGLCDAQIAVRLIIVKNMLNEGETLNTGAIKRYDNKLYKHLQHRYGTLELASKALNINYKKTREIEDGVLIARLRKFVLINKKIPVATDLSDIGIYYKHFGSWNRAKMMAGLDQLLKEVKK